MHKDKPPGPFDFADRSARYAVTFGLATGLVLSIFAYGGTSLWRADSVGKEAPRGSTETLVQQAGASAARNASPTPAPSSAVRY